MFEQQPKRNNEWFFDQVTNKHAFLLQGLMAHLENAEPELFQVLLEIQQLEPSHFNATEITIHSDLGLRLAATLGGILNELALLADFPELTDYLEDLMEIWDKVKKDITAAYFNYLIELEEGQIPAITSEADIRKIPKRASTASDTSTSNNPTATTAISLHRAILPSEEEILSRVIKESTAQDLVFADAFVQAFIATSDQGILNETDEKSEKSLIFLTLYLLTQVDTRLNASALANLLGISTSLSAGFIAWYFDGGMKYTQEMMATEFINADGLEVGDNESPYERA